MRSGRLAMIVALVAPGIAYGDTKVETADRLFAEGKALLDVNLVEACAKFDESYRYNPAAIGTLLNVALCDEKLGKFASAFAHFSAARDLAKEQSLPQHEKAAEQHLVGLEGKIPHLTIKLAEELPGIKVVVDNRVIGLEALRNLPVDPGERVIDVSAPGRLPHETKIVIKAGETQDVVIPQLARAIVVKSSRKRIGQITVIAGGATALVAAGLGIYAIRLYRDQFDATNGPCFHLSNGDFCRPDGQHNTDRARTLGTFATVLGGVGIAAAGVGAYLWLRAPHETDTRVSVLPSIGADGAGVVAVGRF